MDIVKTIAELVFMFGWVWLGLLFIGKIFLNDDITFLHGLLLALFFVIWYGIITL